jgi:DNA-binding GntR family transcriptional regulator
MPLSSEGGSLEQARPPVDTQFRVNRQDGSLRSRTVASLRQAIFSGRFKPGQRLTERELCEVTGVSRPLMREVLRDLAAEGLILNDPYKSPVVLTLDRNYARELYEIRSALEPMAAQLFVERASDDEIAQLERAVHEVENATQAKDAVALTTALDAFYQVLFEGSRNRTAAGLIRIIHVKVGYLRAMTFQRQTQKDARESIAHLKQIVRAIRSRDGDAAARACLKQVNRSCKVAMKLLPDAPAPDLLRP